MNCPAQHVFSTFACTLSAAVRNGRYSGHQRFWPVFTMSTNTVHQHCHDKSEAVPLAVTSRHAHRALVKWSAYLSVPDQRLGVTRRAPDEISLFYAHTINAPKDTPTALAPLLPGCPSHSIRAVAVSLLSSLNPVSLRQGVREWGND